MNPREILDKIKSQPMRERANEKIICDYGLNILYDLHQNVLNRMLHCDQMINDKSMEHLHAKYQNQKEAHSEVYSQISFVIEHHEYYKENGDYGDL